MYQRGEDINIGVGVESSRGTAVTPGIWIPGKNPTTVTDQIDKVKIRETRGTKTSSQGSEIVKKAAGGELEFYVRSKSIGYILKSLMGSVTSTLKGGETIVYNHVFGVLPSNPEHPSLTLGLSQPNLQDYTIALALVKSLQMDFPTDDLVSAKAEFIAKSATEKSPAYTPSFGSDDYYFRHQDVTIKLAADIASLGAAPVTLLKDLSISIENNARHNQNISELNPGNVIASDFDFGGSFKQDTPDKTLHDFFTAGAYKAMSIQMQRADVGIGVSSFPTVLIEFAKISAESYEIDRPIDDIVQDGIGFASHYSLSDSLACRITVTNLKANYTT